MRSIAVGCNCTPIMSISTTPIEALLAQEAWAKSLAKALVRDSSHADDLVQRAFQAALARPPQMEIPPRRWLGRVIRNLASYDARSRRNRQTVERQYATKEGAAPPADHALRILESRALLQDALLALQEPYRSVITERYLEGLTPREIARRRNLPVKTVKSQLVRALEALRERLDRSTKGDRTAWLSALAPLLSKPPTPIGTTTAVSVPAILCAVVLLVTSFLLWNSHNEDPTSVASASSSVDDISSFAEGRLHQANSEDSGRASSERATAATEHRLRVHVVDSGSLNPAAGARVALWPLPQKDNIERTVNDWFREGTLELNTHEGSTTYLADQSGTALVDPPAHGALITSSLGSLWGKFLAMPDARNDVTIELREDRTIGARVIDITGKPVVGVRIQLRSMGYCGEGGDNNEYLFGTTSPIDGLATLRHVGYVMNAEDSACKASAELHACITGFSNVWDSKVSLQLDRTQLPTAPIDFLLNAPIGFCELTLKPTRAGLAEGAMHFIASCHDEVDPDFQYVEPSGRTVFPVAVNTPLLIVQDGVALTGEDIRACMDVGLTTPGETIRIDFSGVETLECTVVGRALGDTGSPLSNTDLAIASYADGEFNYWFEHWTRCRTDSLGTFQCAFTPKVTYELPSLPSTLVVIALGAEDEHLAMGSVAINARSPHVDVSDMILQPLPLLVSGLVRDTAGVPVQDATIVALEHTEQQGGRWDEVLHSRVTTDKNGRFSIHGPSMPAPHVVLNARKEGYGVVQSGPIAASTEVTLDFKATGGIIGSLLADDEVGRSILCVRATPVGRTLPSNLDHGRFRMFGVGMEVLQRPGPFALRELDPGEYTVTVFRYQGGYSEDAPLAVIENVFVQSNSETTDPRLNPVDLTGRLRYVTVSVTDEFGSPIDGAHITVDWPGRSQASAEEWVCDHLGRRRVLIDGPGNPARVYLPSSRNYFDLEIDSLATDADVVLATRPQIHVVLDRAVPVMPTGLQLSATLVQGDVSRECYYEQAIFDASGTLSMNAPLVGEVALTLEVRSPQGGIAVADGIVRTLTIQPRIEQRFVIRSPDAGVLAQAAERLLARK